GIFTDLVGRYLTGQDHHGNGVHVGSGNSGDGVGGAGSGGDQNCTYLPGCSRIAISCVSGRLLVTHQDVFNSLLPKQRIVDVKGSPAWVAEYQLDTLFLEGAYEHLSAR